MKKIFSLLAIIIIALQFLLLPKTLFAQQEVQQSRELAKTAFKYYQEKNYTAYLETLEKAVKLRPNHPELTYNFAGALALAGNKKSALVELSKFADFGLIANPAADDDFASIKETPEFQEILKRIEKNRLPIGQAETIFKLTEKDLITEGLAYDPQEQTFYVGSIRKRKIIAINKDGKVTDFTSSQQDGLWGVFGMQIDHKKRFLWVASSSLPEIADFRKEEDSQAAIFQYDLKTKKLIKKFSLTSDTQKHIFGDLTLAPNGDVFITDSISPNIYRISSDKNNLETFVTGPFASLQGISFSTDGKTCFVSDYSQGIFKLDIATKNITKVGAPLNATMLGIDGIYFYQNHLIAVQNGVNPRRVIKLSLNSKFDEIEKLTVIAASKELMPDPTLGMILDNDFYFHANAQWNNFDRQGNILPLDKFTEPILLKLKIK
ncbi:MAG: SMP-30/gluconolactonase/LRE family protein [Acidobacteria bacterium]|nr:SMP-30/gluconolactonase/LRE family protein [Acidobacteriota bacterium]